MTRNSEKHFVFICKKQDMKFGKMVIEKSQIPVVFLTAKDDENDILKGYEAGCEEYVTKPLSPRILEKKIATILKRQKDNPNIMCYKKLKIDYDKRRVWHGEEEVHLTSREWKKIENNMTEPVYIRNVFGVGYTFGE